MLKIRHVSFLSDKVLLYGNVRHHIIEKEILSDIKYEKFNSDIRGSFDNKLIFSFKSLLLSLKYIISHNPNNHHWKLKIVLAYYFGIINTVKPKTIIAFDGSVHNFFSLLTSLSNKTKYIGIATTQLRSRDYVNIQPSLSLNINNLYFFLWGNKEKNRLIENGMLPENTKVVGSLLGESYFMKNQDEIIYDICIPSIFKNPQHPDVEFNEKCLLKLVNSYCKKQKESVKVCIPLRPGINASVDLQKKFYKKFLCNAQIKFIDPNNLSTYKSISKSKITISQSSCTAFEGMGAKKKVLFVHIKELHWWDMDDLVFLLKENSQLKFNNLLEHIITMSDSSYEKLISKNIYDYCYYLNSESISSLLKKTIVIDKKLN